MTTSVAGAPTAGWCSRTQTSQVPSGATSPSAYRSPRGTAGSAVSSVVAPFSSRRRRWSAQSTHQTTPGLPGWEPPGAAAVLVHRGTGVPVRGQQVGAPTVRGPSHELDPAALRGAALAPDHRVAVRPDLVEPDRRGHHELRGHRGRPGSERGDRHGPTVVGDRRAGAQDRRPDGDRVTDDGDHPSSRIRQASVTSSSRRSASTRSSRTITSGRPS